MLPGDEDSESFYVGQLVARQGAMAARRAIQARAVGDDEASARFAAEAMASDWYASDERCAGRIARRANVIGNAWSAWYEQFTGRPSGW